MSTASRAGVLAVALLAACGSPARPATPSPSVPTASSPSAPAGVGPSTATSTPRPATPAPPYLARAAWRDRSGIRTLAVVPTEAGRRAPDTDAVWRELLSLAPGADTPGMRDQLACHVLFAAAKREWHLEPARPAVGLARTIRARCNAGTILDPDDG